MNQLLFAHTLAEADSIIVILVVIVIALVVVGCIGLRQTRIIRQRNEQLRRILIALDEYRAIVGDVELPLDEQEEMVVNNNKKSAPKPKPEPAKAVYLDEGHAFFVKMDARVNKEKPFTDPDFDYYALIKFMGISQDEFCRLVPRYKDPERTKDYINSLRAEYAAKLLMERSGSSMEDMVALQGCGSFQQSLQVLLRHHADRLSEQHPSDVQEKSINATAARCLQSSEGSRIIKAPSLCEQWRGFRLRLRHDVVHRIQHSLVSVVGVSGCRRLLRLLRDDFFLTRKYFMLFLCRLVNKC